MGLFKKELYTEDVYSWHKKYAEEYELSTGNKLFMEYQPRSVVDFGCGIGSYLLSALSCGITNIKGYEIGGEFAKKYTPPILHKKINFNKDISFPIIEDQEYDIVLCVEVAEHIEPCGSFSLVKNLSKHVKPSGICVFTSAPPGQEGHQHINCRPKEDWNYSFKNCSMIESIPDRDIILKLWEKAPSYVLNNLSVYKLDPNWVVR